MNELWQTTVNDLMLIFRDGLDALVPIAARARIPWKAGQAYDEWDEIAEALFDSIVVKAIQNAQPFEQFERLALPMYDEGGECLNRATALIEVVLGQAPSTRLLVFRRFESQTEAFDQVVFYEFREGCSSSNTESAPVTSCKFCLRVGSPEANAKIIEKLNIAT